MRVRRRIETPISDFVTYSNAKKYSRNEALFFFSFFIDHVKVVLKKYYSILFSHSEKEWKYSSKGIQSQIL